MEPPYAKSKFPPDETAENVEAEETLLPQVSVPPETAHLPLDVDIVKPEVEPDSVYVASVCVDHVPADNRPPVDAVMCALDGRPPEVGPGPEEVDVVVPPPLPEPDFGGYLIPLDGQDPSSGASMATKLPSIRDPLRLKYQLMEFKLLPSQLNAGFTPAADSKAEVRVDRLYVLLLDGVIPPLFSQSYVGRVLNNFTTVSKKATASAPLGLPLGKQLGSKVL